MQTPVFDMWSIEPTPVLLKESLKSEVLTLASCLFPKLWEFQAGEIGTSVRTLKTQGWSCIQLSGRSGCVKCYTTIFLRTPRQGKGSFFFLTNLSVEFITQSKKQKGMERKKELKDSYSHV